VSEKTNYNHNLPEETPEKKLFDHVPQHSHKNIMKKKTKKANEKHKEGGRETKHHK
jgi:hypothetical protein